MRRYGKNRRGFTMMEIAIVLGVIGVIVAAIFTAASLAEYRVTSNQASDELSQTAINVRNLYAGRPTNYAALNAVRVLNATPTAADYAYYMPILIAASVFPREMKTAANIINNPWNAASAAHTVQVSLAGSAGNPVQFVVEYRSLTAQQCTDLLVRNSAPGTDAAGHPLPDSLGLQQIKVNNVVAGISNNAATPLPVTPLVAAGANACGGAAPFTIDWYYALGS